MQKIAATLPLSREEAEPQKLSLKKQSLNKNLKEEEPGQPPKSKNNTKNIISSLLFLALTKSEEVWLMDNDASKHMTVSNRILQTISIRSSM
jgi:hypothetical protein